MKAISIAVLISGAGRSLQNLIDRVRDGSLPARIVLVVSSKEGVEGIGRAEAAGIPVVTVARRRCAGTRSFSRDVLARLGPHHPDLVVMAGLIHRVVFPRGYDGRVMNIHPALLPAFGGKGYYGMNVHEAVLASGAKETGCTVHFVDARYDHGPIILQRTVRVLPGDTPHSLADRVFEQERIALPEAIRLFAERKLRITGQGVTVLK